MYVSIQSPELFHIQDLSGKTFYGADQEWYPLRWQRQAGCGPTNFAHLIWYLARSRSEYSQLLPEAANQKKDLLNLMEETWKYVTPGKMGVNSTALFAQGASDFYTAHDLALTTETLDIPAKPFLRPTLDEVGAFLEKAFRRNLPVAFLNLSNGKLSNLDNWHWVTLTGYDDQTGLATMYDQSIHTQIDLKLWLTTTALGGGFVTAVPK